MTYQQVMNDQSRAPFVQEVLADACVSISDLKRNPAAVIAEAKARQVAILNRNKPVAYVISPEVWRYLCDLVENASDEELIRERLTDIDNAIPVTLDELRD